jgi:xanthine dehydrogenase accessory factor
MRNADGSWEKFDDYVVDFALDALAAGRRVALVTLVLIDGASPRALGAQMAVGEDGDWVGYLSGGCIERAVISEALAAIEEGHNRRIRYGKGSPYLDISLPCGSAIELYFDVKLSEQDLRPVADAVADRAEAGFSFLAEDCETSANNTYSMTYLPRRRLVVLGTGPVAVLLCRLAAASSFEVALYSNDEPTLGYAAATGAATHPLKTARRVPDIDIDSRTAIAFLFHDHDWEEELLPAVLGSDAFYIGAIGSRRTHGKRVEMLRQRGISPIDIERIHGPAGLFAGSKSAPDIALSILAEVVKLDPNARDDRLAEGSIRPRATAMDAAEARLDCRAADCSARN